MTSTKPKRWLDRRGVIAIHKELITRYGGHSRKVEVEEVMVDSALLRAERFAVNGKRDTWARLAAGYAWALLKLHPFAEGNEMVALAALVVQLEMYDLPWKCGEVEETAMIQALAAGHLKEKAWEEWVVDHVKKEIPAPKGFRRKKK
jgi:prophage maintenance system killer protein